MQNASTIQMAHQGHEIDHSAARGTFRAISGKVVVEMIPAATKIGSLLLPDSVAGNMRPDMGVVISQQIETRLKGRTIRSPKPGTVVCVAPYDGVWVEGADFGGYSTENQIRTYGHYCQYQGSPIPQDWWDSILCEYMDSVQAYGDKVVLQRDDFENKTGGGIFLPDTVKQRGAMATVLSAGPLADDLKDGDRVCFDPKAVEYELDGYNGQVVLSVTGINYVLQ